jgi:hypothetical protein
MESAHQTNKSEEVLQVIEKITFKLGEEVIEYYLYKDGQEINLNQLLKMEINDAPELFSNDLAFICVGAEDDDPQFGIYSFQRRRVIFPFIIADYEQSPDGTFKLGLVEGWEDTEDVFEDIPELIPGGNIAFLNRDGLFLQNLGVVIEQLDKSHYIIVKENGWSPNTYLLYNSDAEPDESVLLHNLTNLPDYIEQYQLLNYRDNRGSGVFDLIDNKILFHYDGGGHLSVLNRSFFQVSYFTKGDKPYVHYRQVLNSSGKILLAYSIHGNNTSKQGALEQWIESDIELYFEDDFHKANLKDITINHDKITLSAYNVIKDKLVHLQWLS